MKISHPENVSWVHDLFTLLAVLGLLWIALVLPAFLRKDAGPLAHNYPQRLSKSM